MSIIEQAKEAITVKALQEPSTTPEQAAIDPATLTLIIDSVMRLVSTLCGGASSLQTAQAMKSPNRLQRWQHRKNCVRRSVEFVTDPELDEIERLLDEGRRDDEGGKDWRLRRKGLRQERRRRSDRLELQRDEYARRAYYGMRKSAEEQPVELIAETVEAYRVEEGMVVA